MVGTILSNSGGVVWNNSVLEQVSHSIINNTWSAIHSNLNNTWSASHSVLNQTLEPTGHNQDHIVMHNDTGTVEELLSTLKADFSPTSTRLPAGAMSALSVIYISLMVVGVMGNSMIIAIILARPNMRTARNVYIVNLAMADFLLCAVAVPLTLQELSHKYWQLATVPFLCKTLETLKSTLVFVCSFSITAIAVDRFVAILFPHHTLQKIQHVLKSLPMIWLLAMVCASPMTIHKNLELVFNKTAFLTNSSKIDTATFIHIFQNHSKAPMIMELCQELECACDEYAPKCPAEYRIEQAKGELLKELDIDDELYVCNEDMPKRYRLYYSIMTMIVQYLLPCCIISFSHILISNRIRKRTMANPLSSRKSLEENKIHKTNVLLATISLLFFFSWLPLSTWNLVMDYVDYVDAAGNVNKSIFGETPMLVFAISHVAGCISPCLNPMLYGYFNENFRKEMLAIISQFSGDKNSPVLNASFSRRRHEQNQNEGQSLTFVQEEAPTVATSLTVSKALAAPPVLETAL